MVWEKIIETKMCKHCWTSFDITDKDLEFYDKISPTFAWKKYSIPSPTICPDCRQQRRMAFRNERKLYHRTCDFSGKMIISAYSSDKPYKIYDQKIRWSDQRDPMQYGQDFDFSRPFFDQFQELMLKVPRQNLANMNTENSEYCNITADCKNCYLSFGWIRNSEDVYHCKWMDYCEYCVDCSYCDQCKLCYQCLECKECFQSKYLIDCKNCSSCSFCLSCQECKNCLGCANLHMAECQILNKPATKEIIKETLTKIATDRDFAEKFKKQYDELLKTMPRKYAHITQCENCMGDYLDNCKNCSEAFQAMNCEECKYMYLGNSITCGYESTAQKWWERSYEIFSGIFCSDSISCSTVWYSNNVYYCDSCFNSSHLFGCIGLNNKHYCVFNKQYTQADYEVLMCRIVEHMIKSGEWCEFFPPEIAPFAYNETIAIEEYPLPKEEVLRRWYSRIDQEIPLTKVVASIDANQLPYDISQVSDDILNQAIICEISGKAFRVVKPELDFYRRYAIPLPHRHPDVRHMERMAFNNPRKLRNRKCSKCWADIKTSYAPERPEIVYCEQCYNKEVYG